MQNEHDCDCGVVPILYVISILQTYILFGENEDYKMFKEMYDSIKFHMRRG